MSPSPQHRGKGLASCRGTEDGLRGEGGGVSRMERDGRKRAGVASCCRDLGRSALASLGRWVPDSKAVCKGGGTQKCILAGYKAEAGEG